MSELLKHHRNHLNEFRGRSTSLIIPNRTRKSGTSPIFVGESRLAIEASKTNKICFNTSPKVSPRSNRRTYSLYNLFGKTGIKNDNFLR